MKQKKKGQIRTHISWNTKNLYLDDNCKAENLLPIFLTNTSGMKEKEKETNRCEKASGNV